MDYLKKIKEEYPFLEPYSGDLDWDNQAYSFLREKNYGSAEELFKKICISEPEHHSGLEGMAYISYVHGEYEKAQWFMNEALQRARVFLKDDSIDPTIVEEMELRERCIQARDDLEVWDTQLNPGEVKDLYSQDPETWLDIVHEAGLERRYQMVMSVLDLPLPFEVSDPKEEDEDFIGDEGSIEQRLKVVLFELYIELVEMQEMDRCRQMLETYRSRHPELYRKDHTFLDKHLIQQAFFRGELERVKEYLNFLQEEPLEGISELVFTLEMYLFYGLNEQAEELGRFLYRCIQESPNPDVGRQFLHVSYMNLMENVYHRLQKGEDLTREELSESLQEFDFHVDMTILEDVLLQLSPGQDGEKIKTLLGNETGLNNRQIMRLLHWQFCKYMLGQKEMSFAASDFLLVHLGGVFEEAEGSQNQISAKNFTLRPQKMIPYLIEMTGTQSINLPKAGAALWVAPYFYDFLWENGVIKEGQHQKTQEEIRELKKSFIQDYPDRLWEFDFVHSWAPTHSEIEEEKAYEKERFKKSFLLSEKKKNLAFDKKPDNLSQSLHAQYFDIMMKDSAWGGEDQSFDKDLSEAQKKILNKRRQKKKETKKQKQKQRKKKKKKK